MRGSGKVVVQNIATRELVCGEGPPLLLIHGWGASLDLLAPLARRMSQRGYRCHAIDLPGFGESDEPPSPYTVSDYADFCLAYLDQHDLRAVHYFGHSLGGRIGLVLAAEHSQRIRSMVLSNSAGVVPKRHLQVRARLRLYQSLRKNLERAGAKATADKLRATYNRRYGSSDFLEATAVMRQSLVKIVNQDLLPHARRVAAPTVLVWGDADEETPLWMGETLEAAIPDAALIVHAGASHYAYLDFPDKTAAIMDALYRSH